MWIGNGNKSVRVNIESRNLEKRCERRVEQIVGCGLLVALISKVHLFFVGFKIYQQFPLDDAFFPDALQNEWLYLSTYVATLVLVMAGLMVEHRKAAIVMRCFLVATLFLLCLHQQTYNDVTFMTGFWVALWWLWFAIEKGRCQPRQLLERATTFSHLILAMIFLGGAVGKCTPGYWNGDVIYGIYFESRNHWFFNTIRSLASPDDLPVIATWYSRMIITMEWCCAFIWIMPPRIGSALALLTLLGISCFSNPYLISVVGSLIGLSMVGIVATVDETTHHSAVEHAAHEVAKRLP